MLAEYVLSGTPDVPVTLRRSARARRMSLRISQLDGRVTLTIPLNVTQSQALSFVREKEPWIRKHLRQCPESLTVVSGCKIPVEGVYYRLAHSAGRQITIKDSTLAVPGPVDQMPARLQDYLKQMARERLVAAADFYAKRSGRRFGRITLRDTRSRWGSCSSDGNLMFSWRLIMAPEDILQYVAAHEVAHLTEMNHSPAFWQEVERIYGNYSFARNWLKTEGNSLHRIQFGN